MAKTTAAKTGVDDYLAAGGTIAELKLMARPFNREDFAGVRLSRDEKLRAAVEELQHRWRDMPTVKQGECTDSNTARELIKRTGSSGELVEEGVRIRASVRSLAQAVGVSTRGQLNSLRRLEASGFLRPDNKGRRREQAGAYILLTNGRALGKQYGKRRALEEKVKGEGEKGIPLVSGECDPGVYLARAEVPALRWSRVIVRWERDKTGQRRCEVDPLVRLGKKRGAIIEYLLESGGTATIAELMERFAGAKTRPRDFKRRTLAMLEGYRPEGGERYETGPAVVLVEGNVVSLVHGWRDALETHRSMTREIDREEMGAVVKGAATLQAEEFARQRQAFRRRHEHPPDPEPEMPQVDDMREPWPRHPEGCACRECSERFGRVIEDHVENCRCAKCSATRKEADRERVVQLDPDRCRARPPGTASVQEAPAAVVPIRPEPEDWRSHPLDCECSDCLHAEPKYARPYAGSGVTV